MKNCIFCKIISGDIPSTKIYETDNILVIKDINPHAPVHDLIITKKHIKDLNEITEADKEISSDILSSVKKIAEIEKIAESGYRLISNTGKDGGQIINHLHFHILGGKELGSKLVND